MLKLGPRCYPSIWFRWHYRLLRGRLYPRYSRPLSLCVQLLTRAFISFRCFPALGLSREYSQRIQAKEKEFSLANKRANGNTYVCAWLEGHSVFHSNGARRCFVLELHLLLVHNRIRPKNHITKSPEWTAVLCPNWDHWWSFFYKPITLFTFLSFKFVSFSLQIEKNWIIKINTLDILQRVFRTESRWTETS